MLGVTNMLDLEGITDPVTIESLISKPSVVPVKFSFLGYTGAMYEAFRMVSATQPISILTCYESKLKTT